MVDADVLSFLNTSPVSVHFQAQPFCPPKPPIWTFSDLVTYLQGRLLKVFDLVPLWLKSDHVVNCYSLTVISVKASETGQSDDDRELT